MALILDGTNGLSVTGDSDLIPNGTIQEEDLGFTVQSFPSGTAMLFQQTSAPTGWTKSTTHDNKALRVVSGTVSSGGSVAFTTAFASKSVSGTVGNTTLTTAQMPSHRHSIQTSSTDGSPGANPDHSTGGGTAGVSYTDYTGSSSSHNHSFTGTAIDLDVQYVDLIIATKD